MTREATDENLKDQLIQENPELNPDFIFARPSRNFRSTEINAVLGLSQIKRLDENNRLRKDNFNYFINNLNPDVYITDLETEGQCNYAFIIIMKEPSDKKRDLIERSFRENGIEFRRGLSGGGNQLLQPYMKSNFPSNSEDFKNVNHLHKYSWYVGNYPTLEMHKVHQLVKLLNDL